MLGEAQWGGEIRWRGVEWTGVRPAERRSQNRNLDFFFNMNLLSPLILTTLFFNLLSKFYFCAKNYWLIILIIPLVVIDILPVTTRTNLKLRSTVYCLNIIKVMEASYCYKLWPEMNVSDPLQTVVRHLACWISERERERVSSLDFSLARHKHKQAALSQTESSN